MPGPGLFVKLAWRLRYAPPEAEIKQVNIHMDCTSIMPALRSHDADS